METPDQKLARWLDARLAKCLPMDRDKFDALVSLRNSLISPK
jgi:hypothetical protein